MEKLYFSIICFLTFTNISAQCAGGTNGGALSPAPTSAYQTMNCAAGDFYYTFVVAAGSCFPVYDFSFCSADGSNANFDTQITILDNSGTAVSGGYSDDYCSVQSHVIWTPALAGTYRLHINNYNCVATTVGATIAYRALASFTNTTEYTVNDDAVASGSCTTLTSSTNNQRGCVWDVNSTLNLLSPFSYDFTVNLGASDAGADGMAFVIQNDPKGRCACGTAGGSLGAGGISNSLIVEIDTYLNYEDRDDFNTNFIGCGGAEDPDHLDLWFNGNVNPSLDADCNTTSAGERPVTGTAVRLQNPVGTNYNIENGANHILRIGWVPGSPGTFTARILNTALTTTFATISTTLAPLTLFGTNTPYFGFTASTGGLSNQQTIYNSLLLLPIELIYFKANCLNNAISINWATASETNNKLFELERSMDGIHYTKISTLLGKGSSHQINKYQYEDVATENTIYYYRLKQIDESNASRYIPIIASSDNTCYDKENSFTAYPNPTNNSLFLKLVSESVVQVDLIDDRGQVVYSSTEKPNDQKTIAIETSQFATGLYAIKVNSNNNTVIKKILINR